MNPLFGPAFLVLSAVTVCGNPTDAVILAAMKLSNEPNYSWNTVVRDDAGTYDIEGKTQIGSFAWQRQPMPKSIARRLGRAAGAELEAVFLGATKFVIRTETAWQSLGELPRTHPDWMDEDDTRYVAVTVPHAVNLGMDESGPIDPWGTPSVIYVPVTMRKEARPFSNFQFALSLPHEELAIIVSSFGNLAVDGDIATGVLSDVGARLLLVHEGHEYIEPLIAAGTFKLWIKDGLVVKYRVELAGVVRVKKKRILVQQSASTVVKSVGTTVLEIPAEARRKLGG